MNDIEDIGTFESAERALNYLGKTDLEWAKLKARHQALDKLRRSIRAEQFLKSGEGSVEYKRSVAENSKPYRDAVEAWENALADFYVLDAKRNSSQLAIEIYRSFNSAQKKGNML